MKLCAVKCLLLGPETECALFIMYHPDPLSTQRDSEASLLCPLLAVPPWASYRTSLCLSYLVCHTVMILIVTYPIGLL